MRELDGAQMLLRIHAAACLSLRRQIEAGLLAQFSKWYRAQTPLFFSKKQGEQNHAN